MSNLVDIDAGPVTALWGDALRAGKILGETITAWPAMRHEWDR